MVHKGLAEASGTREEAAEEPLHGQVTPEGGPSP